ncbi:S-(hydroxymethyl)glutathione dehydrogenase [Maudiozyma exigua]|uniref:S-(hydroxymethyl)glutathione dehydrogenase n=1 Tax=Maudiozyma exigua TaxID=34358 RepID=A0A9P6WAU4_MAUEX|nr:S-(hydroxymethyl)glutathione dehydrogenase [Kazachstania exigua]
MFCKRLINCPSLQLLKTSFVYRPQAIPPINLFRKMSTVGKPIECKAAISYKPKAPLVIDTITVDPPKAHEVRIKIVNTAICHTDAYTLSGNDSEGMFPCILGHEGSGIVESVGPDVTTVKVGDHVIPLYTAECGVCKFCKSGKTNLCGSVRATQGKGVMPDGTVRFHNSKGEALYHFMGCSTFSEYTVVADVSVVAIDPTAPLESVCLLGCGVTTGYGAAIKTADVQKGDTVAVFGAGTVGLSVVQGAQSREASKIIVVDINDNKETVSRQFGATDFVNPTKLPEGQTIVDKLIEMTDGGLEFTFDCTGNVQVMRNALEACHKGWGQSIIIGVADAGKEISTRPFQLVTGRVWKGSAFGGIKGRSEMGGLIKDYQNKKLKVDEFITARRTFDEINEGFEDLHNGTCLRTVLKF